VVTVRKANIMNAAVMIALVQKMAIPRRTLSSLPLPLLIKTSELLT
jgi:hypothetical protein